MLRVLAAVARARLAMVIGSFQWASMYCSARRTCHVVGARRRGSTNGLSEMLETSWMVDSELNG
jgi:hypothetical protein